MSSIEQKLSDMLEEAKISISETMSSADIESLRVKYLGKKSDLSNILKSVGNISPEERKSLGMLSNNIKTQISDLMDVQKNKIRVVELNKKFEKETVDVTIPGYNSVKGKFHPLRSTLMEIQNIFLGLGFTVAEGPEIESDYYNFEALNLPPHHPARDMHDTFYIQNPLRNSDKNYENNNMLLRTHTSPVQVRVMEKIKPPVKIIAPGKVYRRDSDVSHIPMFHQVEGLWVDKNITFSNLKYILTVFLQKLFTSQVKLRFRPSFFPFTEPSTEVDMTCVICGAKGCRVCKGTGWLEVLGAGMVDPEVFKFVNYDSNEYSGFAFGLGVDRMAMLKYNINDIRLFLENDVRFLKQF
ncbi:phenylalanine--tRNA ligase subunit alpha [Candidatus Dependentiae bacterium]|nr:phenylalanine--tRNA ligase subunit alpha [Candidatus Dependentiae bacterium]